MLLLLFWFFCAFETNTINLVDFYDIITVHNVGNTKPVSLSENLTDETVNLLTTINAIASIVFNLK